MRFFFLFALVAIVCTVQTKDTAAQSSQTTTTAPPAGVAGIRAFVPIAETLGTAGQPQPDQFAHIKAAGYRVVINLAPADARGAVKDEQQIVEALGLKYIHIPVIWTEPKPADIAQFFAAMQAHRHEKVFVHCIANMRVSAFTYLYRTVKLSVDEAAARADLQKIWTPNEIWQSFIERIKAQPPAVK